MAYGQCRIFVARIQVAKDYKFLQQIPASDSIINYFKCTKTPRQRKWVCSVHGVKINDNIQGLQSQLSGEWPRLSNLSSW